MKYLALIVLPLSLALGPVAEAQAPDETKRERRGGGSARGQAKARPQRIAPQQPAAARNLSAGAARQRRVMANRSTPVNRATFPNVNRQPRAPQRVVDRPDANQNRIFRPNRPRVAAPTANVPPAQAGTDLSLRQRNRDGSGRTGDGREGGRNWRNRDGGNLGGAGEWRGRGRDGQDGDGRRGNWRNRDRDGDGVKDRRWRNGNNSYRRGDWDRTRRDRNYWRSRYNRFALFGGGYYYLNSGYWYPAYGYDPYFSTYSYDAPIYSYNDQDPGETISKVQQELQQRGYYRGTVDGSFGRLTRQALLDFQRDSGLPVSGEIDQDTLAALGFE